MTLLLLVALAVVVWAWRRGALRGLRFGDVAAVTAALVAAGLLRRGETIAALVVLAGVGVWMWRRRFGRRRARLGRNAHAEARTLLELPPGADADAIRAAHRRLIARVHPDTGGTAELARRVNQARDILLAQLAEPGPGPRVPNHH